MTKVTNTKAPRATAFDPASVPVMGYTIEMFRIGRRSHHVTLTAIDGVGAAAIEIAEKEVARYRKAGHQIAYVGLDLCLVTSDLAFSKKIAAKLCDAEKLPHVMAIYANRIGAPLAVHEDKFEHMSGKPYDLYVGFDDESDFDKVDAHMAREYARILKANAAFAKAQVEVEPLFIDREPGRTVEQGILHFAVAAHEHDKQSAACRADAIHSCNVWKAQHDLSKVDLNDPRIKAFTAPVWERHIDHREYAKQARTLMTQETELYSQVLAA